MILQQHVLLSKLDSLIEQAQRVREAHETIEDCVLLLELFRDFESKCESFFQLLPDGIPLGNIRRHFHFTKLYLQKNIKERGDIQDICEYDLPQIKEEITQYYANNKHFDDELYSAVQNLLLVNELSSAVQKGFVILSDRIRSRFNINDKVDGKQLAVQLTKECLPMTTLDGEESESLRSLLIGLYGYFRNRYSHTVMQNDVREAGVVLDMINFLLFEIDRIARRPGTV